MRGGIGVKTDIPYGPSFDGSSMFGIRAGVITFGTVIFSIGEAPHEVTAGSVIAIGLHAQLFLA